MEEKVESVPLAEIAAQLAMLAEQARVLCEESDPKPVETKAKQRKRKGQHSRSQKTQ
jgi:hypothetical protein